MIDTKDLPQISQPSVEAIFNALTVMDVQLDANPLEYGPRRLNNKVAEARSLLSDTEEIFLKVSLWLQQYKAAHRTSEFSLDLEKKNLMANDPEVRAGRNLTTQEALAAIKLRDQVMEVAGLASAITDLEALMGAIRSKRADLKDIQGRLRDQMKLCQEEIGLGGRWGSKVPKADLEAPEEKKGQTLRDLTDVFKQVTAGGRSLDEVLDEAEEEAQASEPEVQEAREGVSLTADQAAAELDEDLIGASGDDGDDFLKEVETEVAKPRKSIDDILEGIF